MIGSGLLALSALGMFPLQAGLQGVVRSSEDREPVAYATVEVVGEAFTDWTDDTGEYRLDALPRGRWRVRVVHPNHDSLELEIFAPGDRDLSVDVMLEARAGPPVDALGDFEPFQVEYTLPALLNTEEVTALIRAQYPPSLAGAGVGGETVLRLWLDERGQVVRSLVSSSSGQSELDAVARRVAERMRFRPAKNGGEVMRVVVQMPVIFVVPPPLQENG